MKSPFDVWRFNFPVEKMPLSADQIATIELIREAAYKAVFNRTGNPDLAACVSDDFELMAKGICSALDDAFLNGLLEA